MFTRALLVGNDLVEIPPGETHHAFVDRNGVDGVRVRLRGDRVSVNTGLLAAPAEFPAVFGRPDADRESLMAQAEAWVQNHPALRSRLSGRLEVDWYQ